MKTGDKMKKIIFVASSVVLMIIMIFYFGIKVNQSKYQAFVADGYIIGKANVETGNVQTTKYYFSGGTKYKKNYDNNYNFKNTDAEEVTIAPNSFVHYLDGSISTLDKTAILDLEQLDAKVIKYYNFYVGSRLKKENQHYIAQNLNNQLKFSSFFMKIDENKYLLVAPKITVFVGESKKEIINSYLEIQFFDGNIIRLENQETQMQNISSNFYIELENQIKINLADKNIFLNDQRVLNMTQITVDRDDNIEIPPEEKDTSKDDEEENKNPSGNGNENQGGNNQGNNGNQGNNPGENQPNQPGKTPRPTNPLDGLLPGIIPGGSTGNGEEEVNQNQKVKEPVFRVSQMDVTSNKFNATIEYQDTDNLLIGDITLKIIETGTNNIIYQARENTGLNNFAIEIENLKQSTNYIFVVSSDYQKNNQRYTRDFIQKTFVTESVGIDIEKNYFTTNQLSLNIRMEDFSRVERVEIALIDQNNQVVQTREVDLKDLQEKKIEVLFNNLNQNTEYKVQLYNFLYDNSVIGDQFTLEKTFKTLKHKPTFGQPSYTIDKKNSSFNLQVNNISDPDGGIISYRYEIYDARSLKDNPTVIKTIERTNKSSVDLEIDNITIQRGIPYVFKLVTLFDDNEKQFEYETDYSNVMQMDGVEFPSIQFDSQEVTFERIAGNIQIIDEGNTITFSENNIITIVYTDSVGISKTSTASGSATIPFYANDLRANETYTISVYTTVDLQDGNPAIDNCFVGSVVIKTEPTKPFVLNYTINTSDTSKAFSVTSQLTSEPNVDNTLEANTLSGLVFNLYSGNSTSGALMKTVRKVDRNLDPYESDLKEEYYDQSFLLDPSFFGLKNQDLQSEYYTIEVTNAYDYTTYKNAIDIKTNIITIKTGGFMPDLPIDPNNAIDVNIIRNKAAGDRYRSDLDLETIVGYQVRASFDNSKRYAKSIEYKIYDATTNQLVESKEYPINSDGSIGYTSFYLKDGTPINIVDQDFRRGNKYYITYTAKLDLNSDGIAETIYPTAESGIVLKSKTLLPNKQNALFKTYPSTYGNEKAIWAYQYTDIDFALIENAMFYRLDSLELGSTPILLPESGTFRKMELNITKGGYLTLYTKENIQKSDPSVDETQVYQYYETPYTPLDKLFNLSLESNCVIVRLVDFANNTQFYNRVAGVKIVFHSGNETIVKDNLSLSEDGSFVIDLADLEKLIGKMITTDVYLYYDNGITGYDTPVTDTTNRFALQMIQDVIYRGEYFKLNDKLNFITNNKATDSLFKLDLVKGEETTQLALVDLIRNKTITRSLTLDKAGYSMNGEHLFPKQIGTQQLRSDGTDQFRFDTIIPGVSLLDESGNTTIIPALVSADVTIRLFGNGKDRIKDNKIYIEVYKTDETATSSSLVQTITTTVDKLGNPVKIENLDPKTNYFLKIMADVKTGEQYSRIQLYDIDFQNNTRNYYFKTANGIGVSNIAINYTADSYTEKKLILSYDLKEVLGYDRISYELYKTEQNESGEIIDTLVPIQIDPDYMFKRKMTKTIDITPGNGVEAGQRYYILIKSYTNIENNGVQEEIELETTKTPLYNFSQLSQPYIGIGVNRTGSGGTIQFQVNIYDSQRVIYNDEYQIKMYNEKDEEITPLEYKNKSYSTSAYNERFDLKNPIANQSYSIEIIYKINVLNRTDSVEEKTKRYTAVALNESGVSIGDVYATTNINEPSKVNLVFYDSYKLTSIDTVRYSLYSSNGYSTDNEIEFVPTLYTNTTNPYYVFSLPDVITEQGVYYIQIQFSSNGRLVAEEAIQYNYVS